MRSSPTSWSVAASWSAVSAAPAQHGRHLGIEIGVGLGRGPDREEQMGGLDWVHAALGDPGADYGGAFLNPRPERAGEEVAHDRSAGDHLQGKDA